MSEQQQKTIPNGIHKHDGARKQKTNKEQKKNKLKNKSIVQEVIDLELDPTDNRQTDAGQMFMNELAKKCNSFFSWISNTNTSLLTELLWKNQMTQYASKLYPELNNDELQRLVERDWKQMGEQQRQKLVQAYGQLPTEEQLQQKMLEQDINRQIY